MKLTGQQSVMSVYGKAHLLDPSSSTCLTLVTTWLAGQVKFHFQDLETSRWRTSKITTDLMMFLCKESIEQKQEPIRRYVYILRKNVFFTTGTGPWHTHASYTILMKSIFSPSSPKLFARLGSPELIPGSPFWFEKYMNISINLFIITKKVSKIYLKTLVVSFKNPAFTWFQILFYASDIFYTLILWFFFYLCF